MITQLPITAVTQDDIQAELVSKIMGLFPDWTDTQASNNMIMLLEVLSGLTELEFAYVNRLARECFLQFALDPRNVYAHAQDIGYKPQFQSPSTVIAVITSASVLTADTTIPAGTQFNSILANVIYETTADVIIRAGHTTSTAVSLEQRQSWVDTFTGSNASNQQQVLNQTPVIPTRLSVAVNGVAWTVVSNFVDSTSTDTVFSWSQDNAGTCTIKFGNGVTGKKPPAGSTITVNYQTGGGSAGSVPANGLTSCVSDVSDAGSHALLSLNAYNVLAAIPGSDPETLAQIKAHAVNNLINPSVLLTRLDIENAVNTLPGVQLCAAVNWEIVSILTRDIIQVFVMPIGGGVASGDLLAEVLYYLTTTKQMAMGVTAYTFSMNYVTLNFTIHLNIQKGYLPSAVQNSVIKAMVNMFDPTLVTTGFVVAPGMLVAMSQIIAILQQIPGVQSLNITAPADTQMTPSQFPLLGTVTFV